MKYNAFLKAVALILCAASLLGLLASAFGMFAMMELGLYNKTVDQLVTQNYETNAENYAWNMALKYASLTLGSCPPELLEGRFHDGFASRFGQGGIGYAIYDEDGTRLTTSNIDILDRTHDTYSYTVSGNYLYLVSSEPVEQEAPKDNVYEYTVPGEVTVIDNLSQEGVEIQRITLTHEDGSSEAVGSTSLGYLSRTEDGGVFFMSNPGNPFDVREPFGVTGIKFESDYYGTVYHVYADDVVAYISLEEANDGMVFAAIDFVDISAEEETYTPIYRAEFYGAGGQTLIEELVGVQPIGQARVNEAGVLEFELYLKTAKLAENGQVLSLVLMGKDGTVLFGQAQPRLQVAPSPGGDGLTFTSDPEVVAVAMPTQIPQPESAIADEETAITPAEEPETPAENAEPDREGEETAAGTQEDTVTEAGAMEAPAEATEETVPETLEATVPETAPETVPETIPETVPETVPETIPETVPETLPEPTVETTPVTEPVLIGGKRLSEYGIDTHIYYDAQTQQSIQAQVVHVPLPGYTVEVFIDPAADRDANAYTLLTLLRDYSALLLPALLASLALLILTGIYLGLSAGRKSGTQGARAAGFNRLPLDLYAFGGGTAIAALAGLGLLLYETLLSQNIVEALILIPVLGWGACLIFAGFCFAFTAQVRTGGGFWWKNTLAFRLLFWCLSLGRTLGVWCVGAGLPAACKGLVKVLSGVLTLTRMLLQKLGAILGGFGRWVLKLLRRFVALLPLTWQWILGGGTLMLLGLLAWANRNDGWGTLWLFVGLGLVLYAAHCFGVLFAAAKRMNRGDLETKVEDQLMAGCFQEFAGDLNALADAAVVAAQKQLRSERMKTELITNVSHDIKTPLTSIINYVDLLQKPHTEADQREYLEVLDRQSQRLKKLIDDLMDMSKASTGNMNVDITTVDAVEAVNQALGEFADKLAAVDLVPVFRHNVSEAPIQADGKLVWRVLSNLLSNAVKYAMPGTRLYLDLMKLDGRVILSMKNISRDELNVDAEELMERFVRGDTARNTEGSGLGLNIAKSLMELQKGHLQLLVDGDLFKVTLVFPTE